MNKVLAFILETIKVVLLALVIVIPIRYFVFQPFIVRGASMEPNFHNGDYLIVDELSYRLRDPARGEVIVFHYPFDPSQRFIKRIIGLPGETIEIKDDKIEVTGLSGAKITLSELSYLQKPWLADGLKVTLNSEEYFVLGDNRLNSSDSRRWGAVKRSQIIGRALIRAWPFNDADYFLAPVY